jgi:hypothetical protein
MAYIGSIPAYQASGVRPRDEFTADGTQICFPLSQSVPGSFESGVTIVLDNVPQQPVEAFTVVDTRTLTLTSISGTFTVNETVTGGTSAATGTVLKVNLNNIVIRGLTGTFSSSETITGGSSSATATTTSVTINTGSGILFSEAPTAASVIYVVHEGNATYNLVPTAASVGPSQLADNLRNFTVDTFTGDGTTTAFTLSDTPSSANSLLVMVDGIVQTRTTNYTLSGAVVTFTDAPDSSAAITIIHLGFSTISRTGLVDGSVTTEKIADNAITSAKLGFDVIVAEDIAANAITVSEIQNGAVTPAKLSTGGPAWDSDGNVSTQSGGDLTFTGTGNRITGDFSNGTATNRVMFQSSTTNGNTNVGVISNGTGTTANILLYNTSDPANASIMQMRSSSDGGLHGIQSTATGTGTTLPLNFYIGGSERLRIDTNGNLFLGATSSASNSTKLLSYTTADQSGITINATNASQTNDVVLIRNTRNTSNGTYNALAVYNDGASAYRFQLTDGGNIGLFGGQIKFPATQVASADANTLDDYEEGTWTPVLTDGTNNVSTYYYQQGSYIKIGKMVMISCTISVFNKGSISGSAMRITGLPFSATSPNGVSWETYEFASKIFPVPANQYPIAQVEVSGPTTIRLFSGSAGNQNDIPASAVGGGSQIFITGTYIAS